MGTATLGATLAITFLLFWLGVLIMRPQGQESSVKHRRLMLSILAIAIVLAITAVVASFLEGRRLGAEQVLAQGEQERLRKELSAMRTVQANEADKRQRVEAEVKRLNPTIGKEIEAADTIEYQMRSSFDPRKLKEYAKAINDWRDRVDAILRKELPNSGAAERFKIEQGQPGQRPIVWEYKRLVTLRENLGAVLERLDFYVAHTGRSTTGSRQSSQVDTPQPAKGGGRGKCVNCWWSYSPSLSSLRFARQPSPAPKRTRFRS